MIRENQGVLQSNHSVISLVHRFFDMGIIILSLIISVEYLEQQWSIHLVAAGAFVLLLFNLGCELDKLYISWRGLSLFKELRKTVIHWFIALSIVALMGNIMQVDGSIVDGHRVLWFSLGCGLLITYRILLRFLLANLRAKGFNSRKVAIAGAGKLGSQLHDNIISNTSLGLTFSGYYDDDLNLCANRASSMPVLQVIGALELLVEDCKQGKIDRVYITLPMRAEKRIKWLISELSDTTASVYIVPDIFTFELLNARNDVIGGIPTISIHDSPIEGSNAIFKRIEDIVFSSLILLLISPVLLMIAVAIKVTSKGPVLFKQIRYGIDGKPIKVWKFRSMNVMENGEKVVQAIKNDARFTPIGAFLRSSSLDELPQFINVLQGRMSIVGPRPHAVSHNEEYRKLVSGYMLRHKVKPGITGWAQINGWRGETDTLDKMEKRIEFDLDYIRNWSVVFDIRIIFLTVFTVFVDKNAY